MSINCIHTDNKYKINIYNNIKSRISNGAKILYYACLISCKSTNLHNILRSPGHVLTSYR